MPFINTKDTPAAIVGAFFGGLSRKDAKAVDWTPTQEEFDDSVANSLARRVGFELSDAVAQRWDSGILACRAADVKSRSREGLLIRWRIWVANPDAVLPASLENWLAGAADRKAAKASKTSAVNEALLRRITADWD